MVTKSYRAFCESLFFGSFRLVAADGKGVPLSPPSVPCDLPKCNLGNFAIQLAATDVQHRAAMCLILNGL